MVRFALLCVCTVCLAACERRVAPAQDRAARPQPPLTNRSDVEPMQAAAPLRLDPQARTALSSAATSALGPYALIRDEAALSRVWPKAGGIPPEVDFRTTNILALRIRAGVSSNAAAPNVNVRNGLTFVVLRRGVGTTSFAAGSHVQLYSIPISAGPVRTIAYEANAAP